MANISDKMMKDLMTRYRKENPGEFRQLDKDIAKFEKSRSSKKAAGRFEKVKPSKEMLETFGRYKKYVPPTKAKTATKVVAKKTIGKAIAKKLPYVGAAILARDVIKGVSKATCGKRGGKWVSGKCVGAKKTKFKPGAKVRDPISKR